MSEKKDLLYTKKSVFEKCDKKERQKMMDYAEGYRYWLDKVKTEREATREIDKMLRAAGFVDYDGKKKLTAGDRVIVNNRDKNLFAVVIGSRDVAENGVRICASHIDSPRLDMKPMPLFETDGIGYFKTHYYGGIRKYQWATIPLALHGVVAKKDGTTVEVSIGEEIVDPRFCISDLLPHLGREQGTKPLDKAFTGEGLNVIVCTSPELDDEGKPEKEDAVKIKVMRYLNEKYGIDEEDFLSAELCAVPAGTTVEIGLDRWLLGGYGHDDRVCAYSSLTALLENADSPENTIIVTFADKEETGSDGPTGMQGILLSDIIDRIARDAGADPATVRAKSSCLSADVTAAFDPNYPDVFEKRNASLIHCGVGLAKYTGSGGKYGTNDATAEFVAHVRKIFDEAGVVWQMAELGKVDAGGGGTVAKYISKMNIDTIDLGVPVMSMHAPFEMISKADLYEAHKAFSAFCAY